jgi:16S rRNA processing protein RimM
VGVRGELTCLPTRVGEDAITRGARLQLDEAVAGHADIVVAAVRQHHGRLVVALEGVGTADEANRFVGRNVLVARGDITLGTDEYLDDDLIGLRLLDQAGRALGTVSAVRHFPAQDCLVVAPGDALVPMVKAFIRTIDVAAGTIVTTLPPGLLDESLADRG